MNHLQKINVIKVSDVEKATRSLHDLPKSLKEVLEERIVTERNQKDKISAIKNDRSIQSTERRKLMNDPTFHPEGFPKRKLEAYPQSEQTFINPGFHPFVASLHYAYAKHYPVVISPDMIWLLIAQAFATHVNENSEKMREYFVDFKGRKVIEVFRDNFIKGSNNNDWTEVFAEFSEKIAENTGPKLVELVTAKFSKTGVSETAAFQVTLMDALKTYFIYVVYTCCGIPEIILEGTPDDWKNLSKRAEALAQYDLDWWIEDLKPILKEFVTASEGNADPTFWESIYKRKSFGSGSSQISGWILEFFPYIRQGDKFVLRKTPNWRSDKYKISPVTSDNIPSGLSIAEFIWDYHLVPFKMEFAAGFVALHQDTHSLALRTEINWAIIDQQRLATQEEVEDYTNPEDKGNKEYRDYMAKQKETIKHTNQYS